MYAHLKIIYVFTCQMLYPTCPPDSQGSFSYSSSPSPLSYTPTLVHQVSAGLGQSSLTEARPGSPLLVYALWLLTHLWELIGVQVSWQCWPSCGVAIIFRAFSPSPDSSIGVPDLSPMFGCECLYLSQSAAG